LGIENLEMFINIYKDWLDEVHVESFTSMGAIHEYGRSLDGKK